MKRRLWAIIIVSLTAVCALELVFVPTVGVLASPPNASLETCSTSQSSKQGSAQCTFAANYYRGGGSLTYCFFGEGALYLRGVYYPLTQPVASPAREISNPSCPAMHR